VAFLDAHGIERTYLYPTAGLSHGLVQDVDFAVALARAYNDWVHGAFQSRSSRLQAMALLGVAR